MASGSGSCGCIGLAISQTRPDIGSTFVSARGKGPANRGICSWAAGGGQPVSAAGDEPQVVERQGRGDRDIQRVHAAGHRDAHAPAAGEKLVGEARPLRPDDDGGPGRAGEIGQRDFGAGAEGDRLEALGLQQTDEVLAGLQAAEGRGQRRPDRDANGLAVERIATGGVEQHRADAERGRVAE